MLRREPYVLFVVTDSVDSPAQDDIQGLLKLLLRPRPQADTHVLWARLRQVAPIAMCPIPLMSLPGGRAGKSYLLTGYDDCDRLLRDRRFGVIGPEDRDTRLPGWRDREIERRTFETFMFTDGSLHGQPKAAVVQGIKACPRDILDPIVDGLLDNLAANMAANGRADFISIVATPAASALSGALLGIDIDDAIRMGGTGRTAAQSVELMANQHRRQQFEAAAASLMDYFAGAEPSIPLAQLHSSSEIAAALAARNSHESYDWAANLTLLFAAAIDSPSTVLANCVKALIENPNQADIIRADRTQLLPFLTEVLRLEPPFQLTPRLARQETQIRQVRVEPGDIVVAVIVAANRDPLMFAGPNVFNPQRPTYRGLSFGAGTHVCPGATLFEALADRVIGKTLDRFPNLSVMEPPTYRRPAFALRGVEQLMLGTGANEHASARAKS